jgi:RNA polymerase sigma-70 factor (ECF subfamily)
LWPLWYALGHRLLGDASLAEDVAQETALKLIAALPEFAFRSSIQTWSCAIALNVARDLRARERRAGRLNIVMAVAPSSAPDALEPALRLALQRAVAALPAELAEVIALRYECDLRFDDIAALLQLPRGTVSTRLRRALQVLGRSLGARNENE